MSPPNSTRSNTPDLRRIPAHAVVAATRRDALRRQVSSPGGIPAHGTVPVTPTWANAPPCTRPRGIAPHPPCIPRTPGTVPPTPRANGPLYTSPGHRPGTRPPHAHTSHEFRAPRTHPRTPHLPNRATHPKGRRCRTSMRGCQMARCAIARAPGLPDVRRPAARRPDVRWPRARLPGDRGFPDAGFRDTRHPAPGWRVAPAPCPGYRVARRPVPGWRVARRPVPRPRYRVAGYPDVRLPVYRCPRAMPWAGLGRPFRAGDSAPCFPGRCPGLA